ncbi:MAG: alpha/beta hydrolase [Candidatus Cryosericum sp.]|nr:alpha/beta hydrolase [bacterium]
MSEEPRILEGITERMVETPRIRTHVLFSGMASGTPIVFIHGNFSSATFFEETMLALPEAYRAIAPDMRGYGLTEDKLIDATRGAADWTDDLDALFETLELTRVHLVGWSIGGGIVMSYAIKHPEKVLSLTLIAPISPFGFGGTKGLDGTPCTDDYAGSGGGAVNRDFIKRIQEHDCTDIDPNSPRNVINAVYYKPPFRAAREEDFLTAALLEKTGNDKYPGDALVSSNWPFVAPGQWGPMNATSPKYFNTSDIVDVHPKPPILWVRGKDDLVVSDTSMLDLGMLGRLGYVPGYPGEDVFPPQPMVSQMRAVLEEYRKNGGKYSEVTFADCGHSPHIEKAADFRKEFLEFLESKA